MTQQAVTGLVPERLRLAGDHCDTNQLAGFGSEASEDHHHVLNTAHTTKGMTAQ